MSDKNFLACLLGVAATLNVFIGNLGIAFILVLIIIFMYIIAEYRK